MKQIAVIGAYFGDEAKARIVHEFAPQYDWTIRFSGSSNAGHTIYRDGKKYVHNLLPSADYRFPKTKSFLGAGMVINPEELLKEVKRAEEEYPGIAKTIYVDPDAFIIDQKHIEIDKQKNGHIGSTCKGVGPAYVEKINRSGTRIHQLLKDNNPYLERLKLLGVNFKYVYELFDELKKSNLIFEGSQSVLLDPNLGTYPYVTSSDTGVSGIYSSGFGFVKFDAVYGIIKAYSTRVGNGPFPTELHGEEDEKLRQLGQEFGATTGRSRRTGWLDLPAVKLAAEKGGITNLIVTKLDILNGMDQVPVCTSYKMPMYSASQLDAAVPTYTYAPGWKDAKTDPLAINFAQLISDQVGIPVSYISCGVNSEDLIKL